MLRVNRIATAIFLGALLAACGSSGPSNRPDEPPAVGEDFLPPGVAADPLPSGVLKNLQAIVSDPTFLTRGNIEDVGTSGDVRAAWPLVDLLRIHDPDEATGGRLVDALAELTGRRFGGGRVDWVEYTDLLLEREVLAPPGYLELKRAVYVSIDSSWTPFFDPRGDLDWRTVAWGGVLRNGIPALVDPPIVPATEGGWIPDDDVVFGLVVNGRARAYPFRVLEVHELVNDRLGGRRIALPFCTLCNAVIGYLADETPLGDELRLRTSGLLQLSNKLMYDEQTLSLFDQFLGVAVTGPMLRDQVVLPRLPVVTTTWGQWKEAHPGTTVIAEGAGTGRTYDGNFIGDRDANGPIFPIGPPDDRLPVQEVVFGVESPRGAAVAFPVDQARAHLRDGRSVRAGGIELRFEAGGLEARPVGGEPVLPGHQAYWFAWSQFRPDTLLWSP